MKKLIVTLITASLVLRLEAEENLPAQTGNQPQPLICVALSSTIANKYLFSATGLELSRDPVVQTDLFFTHKSGLYLDLWVSRSLQGKWDDGSLGNEIDYGVGWNGTIRGFTAHIGVTYFDEPRSFTFGAEDIIYSHVRVGKDFKHLTLTLGYENLVSMPGSSFQGGNVLSLTASKAFSFWSDKLTLPVSLSGVYDDGTAGAKEEVFLKGTAGLSWNITKRFTANVVSINYFLREKTDAVFSTGFAFSF